MPRIGPLLRALYGDNAPFAKGGTPKDRGKLFSTYIDRSTVPYDKTSSGLIIPPTGKSATAYTNPQLRDELAKQYPVDDFYNLFAAHMLTNAEIPIASPIVSGNYLPSAWDSKLVRSFDLSGDGVFKPISQGDIPLMDRIHQVDDSYTSTDGHLDYAMMPSEYTRQPYDMTRQAIENIKESYGDLLKQQSFRLKRMKQLIEEGADPKKISLYQQGYDKQNAIIASQDPLKRIMAAIGKPDPTYDVALSNPNMQLNIAARTLFPDQGNIPLTDKEFSEVLALRDRMSNLMQEHSSRNILKDVRQFTPPTSDAVWNSNSFIANMLGDVKEFMENVASKDPTAYNALARQVNDSHYMGVSGTKIPDTMRRSFTAVPSKQTIAEKDWLQKLVEDIGAEAPKNSYVPTDIDNVRDIIAAKFGAGNINDIPGMSDVVRIRGLDRINAEDAMRYIDDHRNELVREAVRISNLPVDINKMKAIRKTNNARDLEQVSAEVVKNFGRELTQEEKDAYAIAQIIGNDLDGGGLPLLNALPIKERERINEYKLQQLINEEIDKLKNND